MVNYSISYHWTQVEQCGNKKYFVCKSVEKSQWLDNPDRLVLDKRTEAGG